MIQCVVMAVIHSLLVIGQALFLSYAIVGLWEGEPLPAVAYSIAGFAVCFIGRSCARSFQDSRMETFAHESVSQLRGNVVEALYDSGLAMPNRFGTAAVVTTLVDGCSKTETYLRKTFPKVVELIVVPLCICIAVFTQDVISGTIVLVCFPFIIAFMRLIGYTASDESAKRHEGFVEMSNHFMDSLRGMSTLRAFGVSKAYAKSVHAASESYRKMVMKTLRIAQLSGAVLDIFATCGLAAVAIMLGFRMVEGGMEFLPALIVLMLVPEYFMPIKAYASDYHASLDGKTALSKLLELASCERDAVSVPDASIHIKEGSKVALVGPSGSGKSSVLDVLAGASDLRDGDVGICDASASALPAAQWRSHVAYIPQHPYVLDGTLRENVALYAPDAGDDALEEALRSVGLGNLVDDSAEGLNAHVGRSGRRLSGGEAHRVAIARAIVGGRDVWLLDEPGSSLDEQTDLELKEAICPLAHGKTLVVATHRDHWLDGMDEVVDIGSLEGVQHV